MKSIIVFLCLTFSIQLCAIAENHPLIFVSCSSKCGSQTLTHSFKEMKFNTLFSHDLKPHVCHDILEKSKNQPILLIDSTRDLIARKIAGFFQHHLIDLVGMRMDQILELYKKNKRGFLNFLIVEFNKIILSIAQDHSAEYWRYLGCDYLMNGVFDFEKKYQLIQIGNLYFVNLRFDDIEQWESIIKSLPIPFHLENFKMITSNQAKDKDYRDLYAHFLKKVKISRSDFNEIVRQNINHLEHFYTDKEREDFIGRWQPYLMD